MTDKLQPERRSENMRRIRSRDTSPEMIVRRLVHGMGFRYRLHLAWLPGKPDLVFPGRMKIIEIRGCFWHMHKGCSESHFPKSRTSYWRPKLIRNRRRDKANEKALQAQGWDVMTLWECELKDEQSLPRRLRKFLDEKL